MSVRGSDDVRALLNAREDEHIELKEAKGSFSFETLVQYCVAFANERGADGTPVHQSRNRPTRRAKSK